MADDLVLQLGISEKRILDQIKRVEERMGRSARRSEQHWQRANRNVSRSFSDMSRVALRAAASITAMVVAANRFIKVADNFTNIENRLRSIGQEGPEAINKLLAASMRSRTGIEEMATATARFQKATGAGYDQSIRRIETLNKMLLTTGATTAEVNSVMLQFSQALSSGVLGGDELRSLREAAPIELLTALAKEAGVAGESTEEMVSQLKKLGEEGKLTTSVMTRALDGLAKTADENFKDMDSTVGQAITNLGSAATVFVGQFNEGVGATETLSDSLNRLAEGLADNTDLAYEFGEAIRTVANRFWEAEGAVGAWLTQLGNAQIFKDILEAMGSSEDGQLLNPDVAEAERKIAVLEKELVTLQAVIEKNTSMGFDNTDAIARIDQVRSALATLRAEAASMTRYVDGIRRDGSAVYNNTDTGTRITSYTPPPKPVTVLEPIEISPSSSGSGSGGGRRAGGGGGRSGREERPFFEDIEKDLVNLERQITLIGKSNREVAESEARWKLLDEAKKRGMPINDQLNAQINAQAAEVGRLTESLEAGQLKQEQFEEAIDGIADAMAGALVAGESLRDGLAQVFKQIAADILNSGIRAALDSQLGGGGGWLGGVLNSFLGGGDQLTGALRRAGLPAFDGGGFTGMGGRSGGIDGKGGFPAILHPNETVLDHTKGQSMSDGGTSINITIDGANGDQHVMALVEQGVKQGLSAYDKSMPARVQQINSNPWKR